MLKVFHHWWIPLLSGIIWWGMLIALLAIWAGQGHPVYEWVKPTSRTIMYISDIAASFAQPIFISCAGAQGLLFVLSLASEIYLREIGRLRTGIRNRKRCRDALIAALAFAVVGELGILFVSIFNVRHFGHAHESLLVVFIVFVGVSSLSSIAQYAILDKDFPHKRHFMVSLYARCAWFVIELAMAIAFASCHNSHPNASAVFEWLVSFVYPFYQLIMMWDLWPAHDKQKGHYPPNGDYPLGPDYSTAVLPNDNQFEPENEEKRFFPPQQNF